MISLRISNDEFSYYSFPIYEYVSSDRDTNGYKANTYDQVDIINYTKSLIRLVNMLPFGASNSLRMYIADNMGNLSTSYIDFIKQYPSDKEHVYTTIKFYVSETVDDPAPIGISGTVFIPAKYESIEYHGYDITNGIRIYNDADNKRVSGVLYGLRSLYGGFVTDMNNVVFVDRVNGYMLINSVGGIQPARPALYLPRVTTRGQKTFNVYTFNADPLEPGGESTAGGGTGDFDGTSDTIPVPGLPGISAVDTGFLTLYNPSLNQLKTLSSYMWSNDFFDQIIKLFGDPMDAILSLSIVPVAVPDGGTQDVKVGNVSTGVSMTKAAAQYISVDCGSINMREFWGSALDYAPHTKIQLYLPYIGYKFIDTDEVMNKTLGITYHVDILTGACVAFVHSNTSVLYQFEGNCACNLPVTGKSWANIISAAINVAGTAAVLAGTGSIGAATLASGLVNTAGNVMGAKAIIEHGGTSSGYGGQMSVQSPYLIVERPRQSLAKGYNTFEGYPSNITSKLGDLSGYTSVESIHLEGINGTDSEISEIESLLKGGVIL